MDYENWVIEDKLQFREECSRLTSIALNKIKFLFAALDYEVSILSSLHDSTLGYYRLNVCCDNLIGVIKNFEGDVDLDWKEGVSPDILKKIESSENNIKVIGSYIGYLSKETQIDLGHIIGRHVDVQNYAVMCWIT